MVDKKKIPAKAKAKAKPVKVKKTTLKDLTQTKNVKGGRPAPTSGCTDCDFCND